MMPSPSKIAQLPEDIRDELDHKLRKNGFSDFHGLSAWLGEQGYEISKTSIWEYGSELKQTLKDIRWCSQASKAYVDELDDPENRVNEALMSEVQISLFKIMMAMRKMDDTPIDKQAKLVSTIARAAADIGRASVSQKKLASAMQAKFDALLTEAQHGENSLDIRTLQRIRSEVYGLA